VTDDEATMALRKLAGHWPTPAFDEAQALAWRMRMSRWDRHDFDRTLDRYVAGGRSSRPVVAEFAREIINAHIRSRQPFPALTAGSLPALPERQAWLAECRASLHRPAEPGNMPVAATAAPDVSRGTQAGSGTAETIVP
jgi:hypothetical protein